MTGIIVMWSGSVEDIPSGWRLCNGQYGTPDLRDRFLMGAPISMLVGTTRGAETHCHSFTCDEHQHELEAGDKIASGTRYHDYTNVEEDRGMTDEANHLPPYYALCFIMKMAEPE